MSTRKHFITRDYVHETIYLDNNCRDYESACNQNNVYLMRKVLKDYDYVSTIEAAKSQILWGADAIEENWTPYDSHCSDGDI